MTAWVRRRMIKLERVYPFIMAEMKILQQNGGVQDLKPDKTTTTTTTTKGKRRKTIIRIKR